MGFAAATVFSSALMRPLVAAQADLAADLVEKALEELTAERCRAALHAATHDVGAHVSTKPAVIAALLPMAEVEATLGRLGAAQAAALATWRAHAGGLGGLLGRPSGVPGETAAPLVSARLASLAETMQRDKVVAEPLHALAREVSSWETLGTKLVAAVGAAPQLRRSYQLRRARNFAIFALIAGFLIACVFVTRALLVARSNVLAATAKPDPCAVLSLAESDLGRVSTTLRSSAEERKQTCEANRREADRLAEEERLRKEREEAARKAKEKFEADCDALATHVDAGKLTPSDLTFANDGGLTERVASVALESKDFGPNDPKMPCAGSKSEERLWASFRKGVLAKPWIMLVTTAPAPRVRAAFVSDGAKMPFKLRKVIATRANDLAKFAIRSGKQEDGKRASAWCEVARAVGMPMAGPCDVADKVAKGK